MGEGVGKSLHVGEGVGRSLHVGEGVGRSLHVGEGVGKPRPLRERPREARVRGDFENRHSVVRTADYADEGISQIFVGLPCQNLDSLD